jgi:hypothetical protein
LEKPSHVSGRHFVQEDGQVSQPCELFTAIRAPGQMTSDGSTLGRPEHAKGIDPQRETHLRACGLAMRSPTVRITQIIHTYVTFSRH